MKKNRLNKMFAVAASLIISGFFSPAQAAEMTKSANLDNKVFVGELKKMGDKNGNPAEIAFKNGKVTSSAFSNFKAATYKANPTPRTTMFTAETPKQKEGQLKWLGAVKEKQMDGTLIWYKQEGAKPEVYTMKGELKK